MTINSNTKVTHLPSIKGRNYLFRVTDGTSNRAYDISASDPQMLKDWIEAIQVVSKHSYQIIILKYILSEQEIG